MWLRRCIYKGWSFITLSLKVTFRTSRVPPVNFAYRSEDQVQSNLYITNVDTTNSTVLQRKINLPSLESPKPLYYEEKPPILQSFERSPGGRFLPLNNEVRLRKTSVKRSDLYTAKWFGPDLCVTKCALIGLASQNCSRESESIRQTVQQRAWFCFFSAILNIDSEIDNQAMQGLKQSKITDFFTKH